MPIKYHWSLEGPISCSVYQQQQQPLIKMVNFHTFLHSEAKILINLILGCHMVLPMSKPFTYCHFLRMLLLE